MIYDFTFHNPTKIYFGKTALDNLSAELKQTRIIRTCRKGYLFGIFRQICSCSMFNTTAPIFAKICSKNHPLRCKAILSRADFRER